MTKARSKTARGRAGWSCPVGMAALSGGLLAVACGQPDPGEPRAGSDWNVVLITVDTYRGDHFLTSKAGVALTPRLSAFARESITFPHASSAGCETSPGTAAILTGLLPKRSGVAHNLHVLPDTLETLTTSMAGAGARTAAFVANPVLAPGNGFEEGFDVFECIRTKEPGNRESITDAALEWLAGVSDSDRFLLWAHYMSPHGPYTPPDAYRELFPLEGFDADEQLTLLPRGDNSGADGIPFYQHRISSPGIRDGRHYLAAYAAEVRFMDDEVGRLIDELERRALLERSIVILTSDHGEALAGDNGYYFSHGKGVTEDQVHVPLLLYYPGCAAGSTIERPVSTVDILPTVLALRGSESSTDLDGEHLLRDGPRYAVSQTRVESAIREGPWKLIRRRGEPPRLLAMSGPGEPAQDVTARYPAQVEALSLKLTEIERRASLAESVSRKDPSSETLKELRELGYAGGDE